MRPTGKRYCCLQVSGLLVVDVAEALEFENIFLRIQGSENGKRFGAGSDSSQQKILLFS